MRFTGSVSGFHAQEREIERFVLPESYLRVRGTITTVIGVAFDSDDCAPRCAGAGMLVIANPHQTHFLSGDGLVFFFGDFQKNCVCKYSRA